jgi:hypothetical protein
MRTIFVVSTLLLSVAVGAEDKIQPLDIKVGLWEVTNTSTASGEMPIPADLLSRLTPEQRAMMEERMKARSAGQGKTTTYKKCLTKDQLEKGPTFGEGKKECSETIVTSNSSKADVRVVCEGQGLKGDGSLRVEALNSENVKGSSHVTMTGGDRTMISSSTFTAKWIGPACGENGR